MTTKTDTPVGKTEEANDASRVKAAAKPVSAFEPEQLAAYRQGEAAYRSSIAIDDCPHGEGEDRDAWLAGYGFARKAANG